MNDLFIIILLGIIEGLTEFLPVSSTGHLILASSLLGFDGDGSASFKIAIQLGAILAVLVAYRQRFWNVGIGLLRKDHDSYLFTRNILLGFFPAMVVGALAYEGVRHLLTSPMVVAVALLIGGILILLIERMVKVVKVTSVETMPLGTALAIGVVQCIAMIPGVSRSGATILGALLMGVERKTAAEFSFFLAVPTMAGATVYALWSDRALLTLDDMSAISIGLVTAFLVALVVVKAFVAIVARFGFAPFAWYRIIIGSSAILWLLVK